MRDIVCVRGVLDPCNQRGGARYRLRGGVLDCCNQRGGARYRRGVRDIVCAGGCWTAAIKGVVRENVCAGGVLDPCNQRGGAIKGGVCDIVCAGGCWTASIKNGGARYRLRGLLQSKGRCAMSSAGGGCWTAAIKGGVRDIVCGGSAGPLIKGDIGPHTTQMHQSKERCALFFLIPLQEVSHCSKAVQQTKHSRGMRARREGSSSGARNVISPNSQGFILHKRTNQKSAAHSFSSSPCRRCHIAAKLSSKQNTACTHLTQSVPLGHAFPRRANCTNTVQVLQLK